MLSTRIEQWEVDIRREGLQEGIQKGVQKGKGELLLNLLVSKFGEVPAWAEEKITQASEETIEHWAIRLFVAKTFSFKHYHTAFPDQSSAGLMG